MYMPEHISGTGYPMNFTGIETSDLNVPNIDQLQDEMIHTAAEDFRRENDDYLRLIEHISQQYDMDSAIETDPVRQIKLMRKQLNNMRIAVEVLEMENEKRSQREQIMACGLAGLAVLTLVALFKK